MIVECAPPSPAQAANHLLSALGGGRMTAELLQPDEVAAGLLIQARGGRGLSPSMPPQTNHSRTANAWHSLGFAHSRGAPRLCNGSQPPRPLGGEIVISQPGCLTPILAPLLAPQISADARLRHVLEALLGRPADGTAPGAGRAPPIALAPPQRYGVGPTLAARMSVGHMAEHVRGAGHTLLGYIARSGSFCLVPAAAEERTWGAGDLLIVLRS